MWRVAVLGSMALVGGATLSVAASGASQAVEEQKLPDQVLIKLDRPLPVNPGVRELATTGVDLLDAALRAAGLVSVERVFPEPPRGWQDPAAARLVGLDRWLIARGAEGLVLAAGDLRRLREAAPGSRVEQPGVAQFFDTVPDDPQFGQQWALQNGRLNAPQAWDILTESDVPVAVLDSGIDLGHKDLEGNRWRNTGEIANNGIDDDGNGYIDDRKGWDFEDGDNRPEDNVGHGIHTSGTVGAIGDNDRQVSGIAWKMPVMTLKIGDFGIDWADAAEGIVYAVDNGAMVLSMSWGDSSKLDVVKDALDYAVSQDVLPVAAAGNTGSTSKSYPAAYNNVMAIIATDSVDERSRLSSYGDWCDMGAPGERILSLYLDDSTATLSGTSMACPHVAGVAGMVRHINPSLSWRDTRWVLNDSATDLGDSGFDADFGWGRLDFYAALMKAQMLQISKTSAAPGESITLDMAQEGAAGYFHVLLASMNGKKPGLALSSYDASDTRFLRLNNDPILFQYILTHPGAGGGIFQRFVESFDANGQDQATLLVPGGSYFSGSRMSFAYVSFDPTDFSVISGVSNSQSLYIQ